MNVFQYINCSWKHQCKLCATWHRVAPGEQLVLPRSFLLSQGLCPPCLFFHLSLEGQPLEHTVMDTGPVLSAESKPIHRVGEHFFNFLKLYSGQGGKGKLVGGTEAVWGSKKGLLAEAVLGSTPVALQSSVTSNVPSGPWQVPQQHVGCLLHWVKTSVRTLKPHHHIVREIFATIRCWDHEIPN